MNKTIKNKLLSIALLLLIAIIWGFAFVAQASAGELGPLSFTGMRFCLGALVVLPVALIFEKETKDKTRSAHTLWYGIVSGVALFLACFSQHCGIEITQSAGKSGFITAFYTVLVPIASCILYRQRKGINVWLGAILAMVGLFLLGVNEAFTVGIGEILLFICACLWTAQIMIVDVGLKKGVSPLKFSMIQFFTCGVIGTLLGLVFEPESFTASAIKGGLIPLLYAGVMSVGVAFTLQVVAQKRSDPSTAAIVLSTESLFAAIGGAIILHERMTARGYVGCALMFIGILLSQTDVSALIKKRKTKEVGQ